MPRTAPSRSRPAGYCGTSRRSSAPRGAASTKLLTVTIYITDLAHWPRVNAAYAEVLGAHRPARTVVPVAALHHGYLIELTATGAVGRAEHLPLCFYKSVSMFL